MSHVLREILRLDPAKDYERIAFLTTCFDFPFDNNKALEFALFRTYCVPSIAALLDATGEFERRPQKRYDDTVLLISEFCENGLDSERGKAALARMNAIHGRFKIANEDYLYVLSTFIYEPIRWNARFGWRKLTELEKHAAFYLWREIGTRMGIRDIPETYEALEAYNVRYERETFTYNEASERVGRATLGLFVSWFPKPLHGFVKQCIYAMIDEPVRRAFGFPAGHPVLVAVLPAGLKALAVAKRVLPKRRKPLMRSRLKYPTYPKGHTIEALGP